jgi:hypothetical protein
MRIYIIGNDGITLCREPPAAVSKSEIVVASTEDLHAAPLSGKRLLALWNALPGVEKRRKVGDRGTDRSAVVGDRGLTGAAIRRRKEPVKAGRRDCDAASTRGRNGR